MIHLINKKEKQKHLHLVIYIGVSHLRMRISTNIHSNYILNLLKYGHSHKGVKFSQNPNNIATNPFLYLHF